MRWGWVLLDVGGTLVGPRRSFGSVYRAVLETLGIVRDVELLERALRTTWREADAAIAPGVDRYGTSPGGEHGYWLAFVRRTLERSGGAPPGAAERAVSALRDAFLRPDAWTVYEDVVPALDRLASAGLRLGVVSNWDSRLPELLARLDLARRFDAISVSSLEGVEKPDPRLFLRAVERLGGEASRTLHVGDVPELDGAGASAAGVTPLLLDRSGAGGRGTFRDLGAAADWILDEVTTAG